MIDVVKPGAVGFGQRRDIVKGGRFLPLDIAAAIRPAYNEYPSRFPINPVFPIAGNRRGSRPRVAQGAVEEGVESLGPGGVLTNYPGPRDRTGANSIQVGDLPSPSAAGSQCFIDGIGLGGYTLNFGMQVAGPGTQVRVSEQFPWPFIINHVYIYGDSVLNDASEIVIKVAPDNDTSGGLATTGIDIKQFGTTSRYRTTAEGHQFYPKYIVRDSGWFIKVAYNQQVAATRNTHVLLSVEQLPTA